MRQKKKDEKEKQEQLKLENRELELKLATSSNNAFAKSSSKENKRSRINKGNVGHIKGHIGSFSDGILKLKKFDLKKLNAASKSKKLKK